MMKSLLLLIVVCCVGVVLGGSDTAAGSITFGGASVMASTTLGYSTYWKFTLPYNPMMYGFSATCNVSTADHFEIGLVPEYGQSTFSKNDVIFNSFTAGAATATSMTLSLMMPSCYVSSSVIDSQTNLYLYVTPTIGSPTTTCSIMFNMNDMCMTIPTLGTGTQVSVAANYGYSYLQFPIGMLSNPLTYTVTMLPLTSPAVVYVNAITMASLASTQFPFTPRLMMGTLSILVQNPTASAITVSLSITSATAIPCVTVTSAACPSVTYSTSPQLPSGATITDVDSTVGQYINGASTTCAKTFAQNLFCSMVYPQCTSAGFIMSVCNNICTSNLNCPLSFSYTTSSNMTLMATASYSNATQCLQSVQQSGMMNSATAPCFTYGLTNPTSAPTTAGSSSAIVSSIPSVAILMLSLLSGLLV
jgi:hypothetical protein